jgi:hypothetical protein
MHVLAQAVATTNGTSEHWPSSYWLVLGVPLAFYMACATTLNAIGHSDKRNPVAYFFDSISNGLERLTGIAGWAMAGALTGLMFLLIAAIGLYWDVAWHVDFGRDFGTLFTPPHVTILFGLGGLIFASIISIAFATAQEAPTKLRFGSLRVPWGGLLLGVMGLGAIAAFPLDNLWHWAYGLDVTLWSPTHLQLVTGGSMGAFAVMLLLAEAKPFSRPNGFGRFWLIVACGAVLTAASTFQGEFDFRVPQFNPVYLPILTMAGAGFALVFARIVLGRWGAVKAVIAFLVIRVTVSALVASLHHEFARFPLYLPSALAVEAAAAWVGTHRRLRFGLVAGVLVGTLGLVGESIWYSASGWFPAGPSSAQLILPTLLLATPAAVAASVIGAGFGRAFRRGSSPMPVAALLAAGAVLVAALLIPLPRDVGNVQATIRTTPVGNGSTANVTVALTPSNAADHAVFFGISAWQGGGTRRIGLTETSPGVYASTAPVPVAGKWKAMIALVRGTENMGAPVYLPADPFIHAPAIPVVPERTVTFVRNTKLLLREQHGGPAWPSYLGYTGLSLSVIVFVTLMAMSAVSLDPDDSPEEPISGGERRQQARAPRPATAWRPATSAGARAVQWEPGRLTRP